MFIISYQPCVMKSCACPALLLLDDYTCLANFQYFKTILMLTFGICLLEPYSDFNLFHLEVTTNNSDEPAQEIAAHWNTDKEFVHIQHHPFHMQHLRLCVCVVGQVHQHTDL